MPRMGRHRGCLFWTWCDMPNYVKTGLNGTEIGIYMIRNCVNSKVYVGRSVCVRKRWYQHRRQLRAGKHVNPHLQNAWNLYGESAFDFTLLESCSEEMLVSREEWFIESTGARNTATGYNLLDIKDGRARASEETRRKQSEAQKKAHARAPRKMSDEQRERMSVTQRARGAKASLETRAKMSQASKGKSKSPTHRANIVAALTGRAVSADTRNKLREAHTGKRHSEEARAKMSQAHRRRREEDTCQNG